MRALKGVTPFQLMLLPRLRWGSVLIDDDDTPAGLQPSLHREQRPALVVTVKAEEQRGGGIAEGGKPLTLHVAVHAGDPDQLPRRRPNSSRDCPTTHQHHK